MSPNWVSVAADCVTAVSIIFVGFQAYYARKQLRDDHDRSRREKAVDMMTYYTERAEYMGAGAGGMPIAIDKKFKPTLERFLKTVQSIDGTTPLKEANDKLLLDGSHVNLITTYIRRYLNVLETIAASWRHSISDKDIIQEEFRNVFLRDGKKKYRLDNFLLATGVYPSISRIVESLVEAQKPKEGKPPTGK